MKPPRRQKCVPKIWNNKINSSTFHDTKNNITSAKKIEDFRQCIN